MKRKVLLLGAVVVVGLATAAAAQEPPPVAPPAPVVQATPSLPAAASTPGEEPRPRGLSAEEAKDRRAAIFIMEGAVINAVKSAARNTADELRRIQPGLMMFSSAPVKAHGINLDGYGVLFQVEIPSVIPSVASLVETLGRERSGRGNPAQPFTVSRPESAAMMDPDAHYVASVKAELINVMVRHSHSLELRPGELLIVSARDASEVPGQVAPPSTMTLSVRASDIADYVAGRVTLDEVRKRVVVRGH